MVFWCGVLTDNYFSLSFKRDNIEFLLTYLILVTKELKFEDDAIQELIKKGLLQNFHQN